MSQRNQYPTKIYRVIAIIDAYCERFHLSMREFSLRVGTNAGLVKDIKSGRIAFPRRRTLAAMAEVMRISVDDFLGGPDEPLPDFWSPQPSKKRGRAEARVAAPLGVVPISAAIEVPDDDGHASLVDAGYQALALPRSYVQLHIGVPAEALRLFVTPHALADDEVEVRRGDHLLLDTSANGRREPGICLVRAGDRLTLRRVAAGASADSLGRVCFVSRPL